MLRGINERVLMWQNVLLQTRKRNYGDIEDKYMAKSFFPKMAKRSSQQVSRKESCLPTITVEVGVPTQVSLLVN